jgi:hypothetical protein
MTEKSLQERCDVVLEEIEVDGRKAEEYLTPEEISKKAELYEIPQSNWGRCVWRQCDYSRT